MPMRTLYLSDLDGTLLRGDQTLGAKTIEVVRRMQDQDIPFSYATARSYQSANQVTAGLNLNGKQSALPAIVYNGARIVWQSDGTTILSLGFDSDQVQAMQALLEAQGIEPLVYAQLGGRDRVSWREDRPQNEGTEHYLKTRARDPRLRPVTTQADLFAGEVFYITNIGDQAPMSRLHEAATQLPFLNSLFQREIYRPEYWCEWLPKAATKANAAMRLKTMLGCDRIVAFGDGINDLPMFEVADACYAVANAAPALKAVATGIIGGNDDEAVARWLEERVVGV